MKGNPLFLGLEGANKFSKEVFKNTILDPEINSNIRYTD